MRLRLELASLCEPCASIFLANVAVVAVLVPARALARALATLEYVLQTVLSSDLERVVVKGAVVVGACARQMVGVAGLLLVEASIVREPLIRSRRRNVHVKTMGVLVESDHSIWNRVWEIDRNVSSINTRDGGRC